MKRIINFDKTLALVSDAKKAKVAPFLEELFAFYREVTLMQIDEAVSNFHRGSEDNGKLIAKPSISITNIGNWEPALIHELLHIYIPLQTQVYGLFLSADQSSISDKMHQLMWQTQNRIEHDLFIDKFIHFGYLKEQFLAVTELNIHYNTYGAQFKDQAFWFNEYMRHLFSIKHLPDGLITSAEVSMKSVVEHALNAFPQLELDFELIKSWFISKRFHEPGAYPSQLRILFEIIGADKFIGYAKPENDRILNPVFF